MADMYKANGVAFGEDYFFNEKALGTDTLTSGVFNLGNTLAGLRVRGFINGTLAVSSGSTVKTELETAETADATAWTKRAENTVTATGTALTGEIFNVIPDCGDLYMRVKVTSTGATGNVTVVPELIGATDK